jgi:hypothetical protein
MNALLAQLLVGLLSVSTPHHVARTVLTPDSAVALLKASYPGVVSFSRDTTVVERRRGQPGQELVLGIIEDERAVVVMVVDVGGAPRVLAKSEPTADETDGRLPSATVDGARFKVAADETLLGVRLASAYSSSVASTRYQSLLLFREEEGVLTCVFNELLSTRTADVAPETDKVVAIDPKHRSAGFADLLVRPRGSTGTGVRFQWTGAQYEASVP